MKSGLLRRWAFATVCAFSFAGAARAETLSEAVELAYRTNPNIQAQRAALRALDETYVQARSQFGLNAGLQASRNEYMLRRTDRDQGLLGSVQATTNTESLTIQQPVYTGGRLSARTSAAEADILAGRQQLRRAEIDLLVRVVSAYVNVRRDEQVLKIARDLAKVLEDQLTDTDSKFEVRQVTVTDQAQSRARFAAAKGQVSQAEAQLNASRATYLALVGRSPGTLEPEPALHSLPPTVEAAFDLGESLNPQLLQSQFTEQASRARVAEARAQRRPQLSLRASAQRNPYQPYTASPTDESITLSAVVSQPIFTGGALSSEIRQSIEQNNRDRLLIEDSRRTMIQNISQGWEQLAGARTSLKTQQDEVQADETAFYGVREEEKVGLRSTIEILNAIQELSAAQLGLARGRANEYTSQIQLLALIGTLSVDDLSPGAPSYDLTANFDKVKNKGALPWEPGLMAIDRIAGAPIGGIRPAATEPSQRPTTAASELPPAPPPAAEAKKSTSIVEIMDSTRQIPADASSPVSTNRQAEPLTPIPPPSGSGIAPPRAAALSAPPLTPPPSAGPVATPTPGTPVVAPPPSPSLAAPSAPIR